VRDKPDQCDQDEGDCRADRRVLGELAAQVLDARDHQPVERLHADRPEARKCRLKILLPGWQHRAVNRRLRPCQF
jgi:hypothetical protein